LDAIPKLMRVLIHDAMQVERAKYLQAEEYGRIEDRIGHLNRYKPKTVRTWIADITFAVPQVREDSFYLSTLEKWMSCERALVSALADIYI
jgi:transposase-like protein